MKYGRDGSIKDASGGVVSPATAKGIQETAKRPRGRPPKDPLAHAQVQPRNHHSTCIYLSICLSISISKPIYLSIYLSSYHICVCLDLFIYLFICLSIYIDG